MPNQTYRQAIQKKVKELDKIFDDAENLRDVPANEEEKQQWNLIRMHLAKSIDILNAIDNKLSTAMARYELKGTY
jgi:hypothetical protein